MERPELPPWLVWVWRAWHRLTHDRPRSVQGFMVEMGKTVIRSVPERIPFSRVDEYAARRGYDDAELDFLWRCISQMEAEFLQWWHEAHPPR